MIVDEFFFWICILEIEKFDCKKVKIFFIKFLIVIFIFFGISFELFKFGKFFLMVEVFYEYVIICCYFFVCFVLEENDGDGVGFVGGEEGVKKFKSNDW